MKIHAVEPIEGDIQHIVNRLKDLWAKNPATVYPVEVTKSLLANDMARLGYAGFVIVEYVDEVLNAFLGETVPA